MPFVVTILAAIAAVLSYRLLEGWSTRTWLPAACRAAGWSVVALLLVNASCPSPAQGGRPLVLLDGSLSMRSEEHTSELQSQSNLVCRLLLEKKKKIYNM